MKTMSATYRHIQLKEGNDDIHGFALWYEKEFDAQVFFNMRLQAYESRQSDKEVSINFEKVDDQNSPQKVNLEVSFFSNDEEFIANIDGIDATYVNNLVDCMELYPYIFIVTGFTNQLGQDVITKACYYCGDHIVVDGIRIIGKQIRKYPYGLIKQFVGCDE